MLISTSNFIILKVEEIYNDIDATLLEKQDGQIESNLILSFGNTVCFTLWKSMHIIEKKWIMRITCNKYNSLLVIISTNIHV